MWGTPVTSLPNTHGYTQKPHTYIPTNVCVPMGTPSETCTHIYRNAHLYTIMHTNVHIHTHKNLTCVQTVIYAYLPSTQAHTYTQTHTHSLSSKAESGGWEQSIC